MTKAESHYLNFQSANCDKYAFVARRGYETKIGGLVEAKDGMFDKTWFEQNPDKR